MSRKIKFTVLYLIALYIFEAMALGITFSYLYGSSRFLENVQSLYLWLNITYMNIVAIITFLIVDWIYPVYVKNERGLNETENVK